MAYETVIFDLDGTLLDTLGDLTDAVNAALRHFGYPERSREEVRLAVGNGAERLIRRVLPEGAEEAAPEVLAWYKPYYREHSLIKTAPYPGIEELLKRLSGAGIRMAVVSNKQDDAVKLLVRRFFGAYIPVAIGEGPGVGPKPAPDSLFSAMEKLGARPDKTVYVGDSDVDILTARNAGVDCVSVSWGFRDRDFLLSHGAKTILGEPGELTI